MLLQRVSACDEHTHWKREVEREMECDNEHVMRLEVQRRVM